MKTIFDFNRYTNLIRRQWINFGKVYLMTLGIITGLFISFYGFFLWNSLDAFNIADIRGMLDFRIFLFVIVGLLFVTIIASTYFSSLGDKSKAIFELLIPASAVEKFLTAIFYTFILPILSFCLLFFIVDFAFVSYERQLFADFIALEMSKSSDIKATDFFRYFFVMPFPSQLYLMCFLPVVLSSLFLLGSIYFSKFQYIKTMISLFIYLFVFVFMMINIMKWVTAGTIDIGSDSYFTTEINVLKIISLTGVVVAILVWFIGFLRLKEKEV